MQLQALLCDCLVKLRCFAAKQHGVVSRLTDECRLEMHSNGMSEENGEKLLE